MKIKNIALYILTGTMVTFLASCHKAQKNESEQELTVDVALPETDSVVLHKEYPGYLTANKEVDLVARVNGYQVAAPYKSGDFVKKGTVLFRIEDTQYRSAVNQASAALASAKASEVYANQHFEAVKKAFATQAVSAMEYKEAESNKSTAHQAVLQAQAALKQANTTLGYCTVRAPFDGHISTSAFSDGSYLSGGGSPVKLATIYQDDVMKANFNIEDARYMDLINNKSTALQIDFTKIPVTFSEKLPHSYTADMSYMAPSIDRTTGTMRVQAKIQNPYGELKSGMYAKVYLPYDIDPNAILIKDASIGTDQLGKYVYVVNDSNKIVYTPIEVGETVNDTLRIVIKGLTVKDRYVTKALLKVRDGQVVKPRLVK